VDDHRAVTGLEQAEINATREYVQLAQKVVPAGQSPSC
jgi:hypothetical protein